jgi:hypothetical protein
VPKPESLPFVEIVKRLKDLGYDLAHAEEGILVFWKMRPRYFPYATGRRSAYPVPKYYEVQIPAEGDHDSGVIPITIPVDVEKYGEKQMPKKS